MRTLAFLAGDTPSRAVLARLLAPWSLPAGAEDPLDPRGKGFLVGWSENLANALDTSGFCAFSGAGLLVDGVATLDELARRVLPGALAGAEEPGRALLALGASVALLQHAIGAGLEHEGASSPRAPIATADWARELFEADGAWPDYARRRGLDAHGRVRRAAWAALGREELLRFSPIEGEPAPDRSGACRADAPCSGDVLLRAHGPLVRFLGSSARHALDGPLRVDEFLRALALRAPRAAPFLVASGRPVPVVLRDGVGLSEDELVHPGDVLDLVVAISGG
ncbi:MAG: hypothetical protein HZA53_01775 [Planctomycetes bacterium]|nr:hypothetical protein [Planctomycetota bacterium]